MLRSAYTMQSSQQVAAVCTQFTKLVATTAAVTIAQCDMQFYF